MKKTIIFLVILISLLLFGCIEQGPICGDNKCESGEEYSCSLDCGDYKIEEVSEINTWSNARPFGIIDWQIDNEGILSIVLINNTDADLNFQELVINQNGQVFLSSNSGVIEPSDFILTEIETFNLGQKEGFLVYIPKENISIKYSAPNSLITQTQSAAAEIKITDYDFEIPE